MSGAIVVSDCWFGEEVVGGEDVVNGWRREIEEEIWMG